MLVQYTAASEMTFPFVNFLDVLWGTLSLSREKERSEMCVAHFSMQGKKPNVFSRLRVRLHYTIKIQINLYDH